jgi:phosphatidylserine decarboxylase
MLYVLVVIGFIVCGWLAFKFTLRDPERTVPRENRIIVAPADGKVKYIRRISGGKIIYSEKHGREIPVIESTKAIPYQNGYLIGIWMSYLNVHVQRVPVSGVVEQQVYVANGKFLDPKFQKDYEYINERNVVSFKSDDVPAPVVVVQIASITVRRIVSYLKESMPVAIGDRLGMIRFGSQVDIIIPQMDTLKLNIEVGDRVTAGETIIARY